MLSLILYLIIIIFIFSRITCGWCYSKVCLVGKTAIITGGNSGIGYQTALSLASRGCRVIIADKDDSSRATDTIIRETGNTNVISKKLDLRSFQSVKTFAKDIVATEHKLNILINNAGIGSCSLEKTEDGLQATMQVNYYSHFLLTHLLLDLLKKSSPSRIIFTSSLAAFLTFFDVKDMNPSQTSLLKNPYSISKLCEVIAAKEFANRLKGSGVTVNSLHPGGARSRIYVRAFLKDKTLFAPLLGILSILFGKTCEEGAQTLIYLACSKEVENMSGQFFIDCRRFFQPLPTYSKEFCKKVWNETIKITELV